MGLGTLLPGVLANYDGTSVGLRPRGIVPAIGHTLRVFPSDTEYFPRMTESTSYDALPFASIALLAQRHLADAPGMPLLAQFRAACLRIERVRDLGKIPPISFKAKMRRTIGARLGAEVRR